VQNPDDFELSLAPKPGYDDYNASKEEGGLPHILMHNQQSMQTMVHVDVHVSTQTKQQ
jgi:hypothetical protein